MQKKNVFEITKAASWHCNICVPLYYTRSRSISWLNRGKGEGGGASAPISCSYHKILDLRFTLTNRKILKH